MKHGRPHAAGTRRQGGYTLIEAGLAIALATIVAAAGLTVISTRADGFRVEKAQQEMKLWLEAGMQYRRDTGNWPPDTSTLTSGNYMPATAVNGPFGGAYSVAPSAGNARLRVTYDATQLKFANQISASLPLANVTGTVVYGEVVVPGAEIAHDALLPRDGSRPMIGTLNLNGNQIANAGNISGSGNWVTSGYVQANTFYDYSNSAYYLQPRAVSRLNEVQANRVYGFTDIRTPVLYDYNNTNYYVVPSSSSMLNYVYATGAVFAPIMYDLNDSSYYLDPNANSRLNGVYANLYYDYTKGVYNDQAVHHVYSVGSGGTVPKPSCYGGHTPTIYTAVSSASNNGTADPVGGVQTYATDNGSYWTVFMRVYVVGQATPISPASTYGQILAFTKCQ